MLRIDLLPRQIAIARMNKLLVALIIVLLVVELGAAILTHVAGLEKRQHAERPLLTGEQLVRRTTPGVGLGRRLVESVGGPLRRFQPKTVTARVETGDGGVVDVEHTGSAAASSASPNAPVIP